MKKLLTSFIALSLAMLSMWCAVASAQTTGKAEDLFRAFSKCDRTFFDILTAEHEIWSQQMTLASYNGVFYPKVPDRLQDGHRIQRFAHPLVVNGVELVGYFDSAYALNLGNRNFDWGFIIKTPKDEAVARLKPLIADQEHFLPTTQGAWQRGEHRFFSQTDDRWLAGSTAMGQPPAPDTVERDFYLINGDYAEANESEVTCSIQGLATADVVHALRPDLDPPALAIAWNDAPAANAVPTVYTAPDDTFKINAPAGWIPNTSVDTLTKNPAQLMLKKTDIGPYLKIRRYNAQDIVDRHAFMRLLLTLPINMLHPSQPLQIQTVQVNGADADEVELQGSIGASTPAHVFAVMLHNDKSVVFLYVLCFDKNYAQYSNEIAQLPAAVQY